MRPATDKQEQIRKIATAVRQWAEAIAKRRLTGPDLEGMCAITSAELARRLNRSGIRSNVVTNDNHAYVKCGRWLIDVTLTQFVSGGDPVTIVADRQEYFRKANIWWWIRGKIHANPSTLRKYQRRVGWPKEQWARA